MSAYPCALCRAHSQEVTPPSTCIYIFEIDNLNATCGWTEPIVFLLFKAMIPGSVSECQDIGCLQSIPEYPNALTLEDLGTDLGQCFVTA